MVFAIRFVILHPKLETAMSTKNTLKRFNTTGGIGASSLEAKNTISEVETEKRPKSLISDCLPVPQEAFFKSPEQTQSPENVNSGLNATLLAAQSGGNEFKTFSTIEPLHLDSEIELSDDYKLNVLSSISSDFDLSKEPLAWKLKNSSKAIPGINSGNSILAPFRSDLKLEPVKSIFKEHSAEPEKVIEANRREESASESEDENGAFDISSYYQSGNRVFISKQKLVFYGVCALAVLALLGYIPITIQLYRGSRSSALRYFDRLDDTARMQLFNEVKGNYLLSIPSHVWANVTVPENASSAPAKPIFKGIAYSPLQSLEPECGVTFQEVERDLIHLSNYTTKIRNYGLQCNQTEYILKAITRNQMNMTLAMGIWISERNDVNQQQLELAKSLLRRYPRSVFNSIFVGNEVLFRQDKTKNELIAIIKDVKSFVKKIEYDDLPVGTSELGSLVDKRLVAICDVIGVNVHPFFGGIEVQKATDWTHDYIKYQIEPLDRSTKIVVTEVGWPYRGGYQQKAVANSTNFQYFVNDWVCRSAEYDYFYFEAFDEPWKAVFYENNNTWETEWGLFSDTRAFKENVTLPSCHLEHIDLK